MVGKIEMYAQIDDLVFTGDGYSCSEGFGSTLLHSILLHLVHDDVQCTSRAECLTGYSRGCADKNRFAVTVTATQPPKTPEVQTNASCVFASCQHKIGGTILHDRR